jgi:hypothetical protein
MFARATAVLVALATILAGVYAVITYHFPNERRDTQTVSSQPQLDRDARKSLEPNAQVIRQNSSESHSPNIIGSGNVVNTSR